MKTPWEARVGVLLDPRLHPLFVYSYKPYDSPMYGGQPRIDWHAMDYIGRYWLIEVKSIAPDRRSIHLEHDMTSGQRDALSRAVNTVLGVPLLMVGQDKLLHIFSWRRCNPDQTPRLLLTEAVLTLPWSARTWREYDLLTALENLEVVLNLETLRMAAGYLGSPPGVVPHPGIPTILAPCGPPWSTTPALPSPLTSKPKGSIRMRRKKLL